MLDLLSEEEDYSIFSTDVIIVREINKRIILKRRGLEYAKVRSRSKSYLLNLYRSGLRDK